MERQKARRVELESAHGRPHPRSTEQEVANLLVESGIAGILNFSPIVLQVPEEVIVNNVNLAMELENLSYFIQD